MEKPNKLSDWANPIPPTYPQACVSAHTAERQTGPQHSSNMGQRCSLTQVKSAYSTYTHMHTQTQWYSQSVHMYILVHGSGKNQEFVAMTAEDMTTQLWPAPLWEIWIRNWVVLFFWGWKKSTPRCWNKAMSVPPLQKYMMVSYWNTQRRTQGAHMVTKLQTKFLRAQDYHICYYPQAASFKITQMDTQRAQLLNIHTS